MANGEARNYLRAERPEKRKKRSRISPISKRRGEALKVYAVKRVTYLKQHPACEAGALLAEKASWRGCTKHATEIHHKKRRLGGNLTDEATFCAICSSCHRFVETHANLARQLGLLLV